MAKRRFDMKKYLIASKKGGKFTYDIDEMKQIVSTFPENRKIQISFELASEQKSRQQLGYWFAGVVKDAANHFGWDDIDMYEWLITKCNKKPVVDKFTDELSYVSFGLSRCDKGELTVVIEKAIQALAEQGFTVRPPEDYLNSKGDKNG